LQTRDRYWSPYALTWSGELESLPRHVSALRVLHSYKAYAVNKLHAAQAAGRGGRPRSAKTAPAPVAEFVPVAAGDNQLETTSRKVVPLSTELEAGPLAGLWASLWPAPPAPAKPAATAEAEAEGGEGDGSTDGDGADLLPPDERLRLKEVATLNQQLRRNPKNAALWLQFIDGQDRWSRLARVSAPAGVTVGQSLAQQSKGALVDRKLAIYERALRELPDNEELLTGYLLCAQERWEYGGAAPTAATCFGPLPLTASFSLAAGTARTATFNCSTAGRAC